MKYYDRKIYPELKKHLYKKQVTVITGMRRVGKTTILKKLLEEFKSDNSLYIDFERIDNRELFSEKNYDNIISTLSGQGLNLKKPVCIALDEVQLVKNLPSVIKYLYDNYKIKFILSGSSSYYLKNLFSESLAGRKKIFELYPLDFGEFLVFNEVKCLSPGLNKKFNSLEYERLKNYYKEYLEFGGFPEVVLTKNHQDKKDILLDIISSYINIDIKALAGFRDSDILYSLIKLLSQRVGSRLDYKKLSTITGLAWLTVKNYIDFFEKSYLLFRAPVFGKSKDKEIVKAKKLYFVDNGLVNALADISSGQQLENATYNQLRAFGKISYFALKTGKEIDFILNDEWAYEVKETPTEPDLVSARRILPDKIDSQKLFLIGKKPASNFTDFIWAGDIR